LRGRSAVGSSVPVCRARCSTGTVDLDSVPDGYRTMADRKSIKVMIKP
jgi:hypothetical protein